MEINAEKGLTPNTSPSYLNPFVCILKVFFSFKINDYCKSRQKLIRLLSTLTLITVRKRSCRKVIFSQACVKNSVHRGMFRPSPLCVCLRGGPGPGPGGAWGGPGPGPGEVSAQGESRPRPGGGISQHALRQTPPSRWLLLQTVCILLECILVVMCS